MYALAKKMLFLLPPELAHAVALKSLGLRARLQPERRLTPVRNHSVKVMGLEFANPVGLAAGMDKNGDYIDGLGTLGFGFIEIGTVTPKPQPGTPGPRLFRLPEAEAIINRMGFNNKGVDYLVARVRERRYGGVLGINIGKNFDTPVDRAVNDYLLCLQKVYVHADYVTVNISSPNTPGLRELQHGELLRQLIATLQQEQSRLTDEHGRRVPIAFKIAPDLSSGEIDEMAGIFNAAKIDALIATNTTASRDAVAGMQHATEQGGLSGKPLFACSTKILKAFRKRLDPDIPIIGVGGISSPGDARAKMSAGADLVQLYSALIYQGPGLVKKIIDSL